MPVFLTDEGRSNWLDEVETRYGLTLRYENDLYLDSRSGRIYAGSEYVAKVDPRFPDDPMFGSAWAEKIGAFNRKGGEVVLETFTHTDQEDRDAECLGHPGLGFESTYCDGSCRI